MTVIGCDRIVPVIVTQHAVIRFAHRVALDIAHGQTGGAARERYLQQLRAEARKKHKIAALEFMGAVMPEPEYNIPLYGEGDTAVYVLSRISGEGSDRAPVPGDILLTETEIRLKS